MAYCECSKGSEHYSVLEIGSLFHSGCGTEGTGRKCAWANSHWWAVRRDVGGMVRHLGFAFQDMSVVLIPWYFIKSRRFLCSDRIRNRKMGKWEFLFFFSCSLMKALCVCLVAQSCLTLCNPMDCSLSGSSVHGILRARILEWVAMPSFRGYCLFFFSCVTMKVFSLLVKRILHVKSVFHLLSSTQGLAYTITSPFSCINNLSYVR